MKRIGGVESDVIVTGGLVLGGYLLIKNLVPDLLPNLGVTPQDRQTLDAQQNAPSGQNIFLANSTPASDYWTTRVIDDYSTYGVDNDTDYSAAVYEAFKAGALPVTSPVYVPMNIYYALSQAIAGHFISGNQDAINNALGLFTNQWQVGVVDTFFSDINGVPFWTMLRTGSPWSTMIYGLNGTDLAAWVTKLNALPL